MGRDTRPGWLSLAGAYYFNPLSPHGERLWSSCVPPCWCVISIHSPRMGRDVVRLLDVGAHFQFQSTLPAWGETVHLLSQRIQTGHFNPLSPHGERRVVVFTSIWSGDFNPLSPHGERHVIHPHRPHQGSFQSTLPAWGETLFQRQFRVLVPISIHSPRMGRDLSCFPGLSRVSYFNPLSPHGERQVCHRCDNPACIFQSTLPAWGETRRSRCAACPAGISIHSPRMGRDKGIDLIEFAAGNFNPLSPHGERQPTDGDQRRSQDISIHSPRMGRDAARPRR